MSQASGSVVPRRIAAVLLLAIAAIVAGCGSTVSGSAGPDSRLLLLADFPKGFELRPDSNDENANATFDPEDCKDLGGWKKALNAEMSPLDVKTELGNKLVQMDFNVGDIDKGDYDVASFRDYFDKCSAVTLEDDGTEGRFRFAPYDGDAGIDDSAWQSALEQITKDGGNAHGISILFAGRVGPTVVTASLDELTPGALPTGADTSSLDYEKEFRDLVTLQITRIKSAQG